MKKPPEGGFFYAGKKNLDGNDVLGLRSFLASCDGELNFLTISEGFEAIALDRTEVNEHVGSAFLLNKTEAFGFIEPLNGTCNCRHTNLPITKKMFCAIALVRRGGLSGKRNINAT